jgi:hypothetical protein
VTEPVVRVSGLVKRYGGRSAPSRILCTLANPAPGSARVAGHDVRPRRRD